MPMARKEISIPAAGRCKTKFLDMIAPGVNSTPTTSSAGTPTEVWGSGVPTATEERPPPREKKTV